METLSKALEAMTRTEKIREALDVLARRQPNEQERRVDVAGRSVVVRRAMSGTATAIATKKPR